MIKLLNRKEALGLNKTLTSFIVDFQHLQYNPLSLDNIHVHGEMHVDNENGESRLASQEECDRFNNEALIDYNSKRDVVDVIPFKENYVGTKIYYCENSDIDTYILNLAKGINGLADANNWDSIIVLLDFSTPWLTQENDYEPVKNALGYLKNLGADKDFNGGFVVSGNQITEFFKHLFWIIRCNASLPYCYFSGLKNDFVANICKHGNVHFAFYSNDEKNAVQKTAGTVGLIELKNEKCFENFSDNGAIEGRKIMI